MTTEPIPDAPGLPELPDMPKILRYDTSHMNSYGIRLSDDGELVDYYDHVNAMQAYGHACYEAALSARPLPSDWVVVPPELLRRAIPFLRDEAANYDDDGSNEPLELVRDIETALTGNPNRDAANPGGCECEKCGRVFIGAEWHVLCGICIDHGVAQPDGSGLRNGKTVPASTPEASPQPQVTNPAYTAQYDRELIAAMLDNMHNGDNAYYSREAVDKQIRLLLAAAPSAPAEGVVSPGDAVFAFSAMLTSLPHVVPFGASAWATPGADLAAAFNEANGLNVSVNFPEGLKFPEIEGKLLDVVKRAAEEIKTAPEPLAHGGATYQFRDAYGAWRDTTKSHYDIETLLDKRILYASPQPAAEVISLSREAAEMAVETATEWLDMFAAIPGLEKYERYTYGPAVEMLRDELKNKLRDLATPNPPQPSASVGVPGYGGVPIDMDDPEASA